MRSVIYQGDALTVLNTLPDASVNCCITSPPYWGLRDYGTGQWDGGNAECSHRVGGQVQDNKAKGAIVAGVRPGVDASTCLDCGARRIDKQIGLERTPEEYVSRMVEVFGEVRRVLRDDGTLWLNLGDSYAAHPGQRKTTDKAGEKQQTKRGSTSCPSRFVEGIKAKDLVGIPWMTAFALRADGWFLRSEIIWHKPNPMPESVMDRPTKAHEQIFLLAKSERYYYDAEAIKEASVTGDPRKPYAPGQVDARGNGHDRNGGKPRTAGNKTHKYVSEYESSETEEHRTKAGLLKIADVPWYSRNKRSVWTVATDPFPEAHFATFPRDLILPCVLAGCPEGGIVLDPFSGAGTALLVAKENGRKFVGIELNAEYVAMAEKRMSQEVLFG